MTPMSDLVKRLRWASKMCNSDQEYEMVVTREAADHIEAIEARVVALEGNRDYWHRTCLEAQTHRDGANLQVGLYEAELVAERARVTELKAENKRLWAEVRSTFTFADGYRAGANAARAALAAEKGDRHAH